MSSGAIQAITFDFWRTLFYTQTNFQERRDARVCVLEDMTGCSSREAKDALKFQEQEFLRTHVSEQRTLVPEDAVAILASKLELTPDATFVIELAYALEDVTLEFPPSPIEGAVEAVRAAAALVPVGIISDTGVATGKTIRRLLDKVGFGDFFSGYTFSDETGVSKPQALMYEDAAGKLGVSRESLLHIGDLEPTDVAGAQAVGARAALFAGDNDRFLNHTKADYTFTRWDDFTAQLSRLVGVSGD
jgi:putative hydrolase of the HAD superfamily